jgi:NhaP-type Na+/H+ or K+/H+ antiporter
VLGWAGLRGAVPVVLATFVVAAVVHGTCDGPDLVPATPPALRS